MDSAMRILLSSLFRKKPQTSPEPIDWSERALVDIELTETTLGFHEAAYLAYAWTRCLTPPFTAANDPNPWFHRMEELAYKMGWLYQYVASGDRVWWELRTVSGDSYKIEDAPWPEPMPLQTKL